MVIFKTYPSRESNQRDHLYIKANHSFIEFLRYATIKTSEVEMSCDKIYSLNLNKSRLNFGSFLSSLLLKLKHFSLICIIQILQVSGSQKV